MIVREKLSRRAVVKEKWLVVMCVFNREDRH